MCRTCGCGEAEVRVEGQPAGTPTGTSRVPEVVDIETALLAKNDHLAGHNRAGSPSAASSRST